VIESRLAKREARERRRMGRIRGTRVERANE
jgi:hypothetical protein